MEGVVRGAGMEGGGEGIAGAGEGAIHFSSHASCTHRDSGDVCILASGESDRL